MSKIVVAMSGGVDSSVAAYLLKQQNHEIVGVFMRNWDSVINNDFLGNPEINENNCSAEKDYNDALAIAKLLNIKLYRVDFVTQYYDLVFKNFLDQYKKGLTPNPDIWCNKFIKFDLLIKWIEKNIPDYDFLATGHYAKNENNLLKMAFDLTKDQTYFLAQISKQKLEKVIFPLGELSKTRVREIAKKQNFINAVKKDSVGICFIGKRKFDLFLQNYIPSQKGPIIDIRTNKELGKHKGAIFYTIGQRQGIGLKGQSKPFYIVKKDIEKNILYVDYEFNGPYLTSTKALINSINWLVDDFTKYKDIKVRFRYQATLVPIKFQEVNSVLEIEYKSLPSVTPGQHCVFYSDDICLGGGNISKVFCQSNII